MGVGRREEATWPVARGQREEDGFSRHLVDFIVAVFFYFFNLLVSCGHGCNRG